MLRKRTVASKQALMADLHSSIPTPTYKKPTSFPKLFTGFTFKSFPDQPTEAAAAAAMSPTSILDSKPFSGLKNPFWPDPPTPSPTHKPSPPAAAEPESRRYWDKLDSKGVGLAIVDALKDDGLADPGFSRPESRMVLFGSQLKIQIPPLPPSFLSSPAESPRSPGDFGIKTRSSQLGSSFSSGLSPSPVKKSAFGSDNSGADTPSSPPGVFTGCLSATEMELSEDYTCVISHGPNPRTTHIFDNCIIESCCGAVGFSSSRKDNVGFLRHGSSYLSESFLSFCYGCKKDIGHGKDIYMYRGEKAFCSNECRDQEMLLEEKRIHKPDPDNVYGTWSREKNVPEKKKIIMELGP